MVKTLMLFLDAVKFDYLNEQDTPFLYGLAKEGISANLNTLPGYHIEYSIMSGCYPDVHNVWTWFYLNPENSSFKWIKNWNFLFNNIDKTPLRKQLRSFITYYTSLRRYMNGKTRMLSINKLPLDKAHLFDLAVDKNFCDKNPISVPTLFDVLRKHERKYFCSEWPIVGTNEKTRVLISGGSDEGKFSLLAKTIDKDYDFRFTHVWELDSKIHRFGIDHEEIIAHLRYLDGKVEEIVTALREKEPTDVVIFSDHGMVPITKTVNIINEFKSLGLSDDDYIILPDSTMARVWLNNSSLKKKIVNHLEGLKCGKVYDENNIKELHIPYNRPFVGDFLFAADPGVQISPNFFQGHETANAMHGYVKHAPDLDGIFIVNGPQINPATLKDVQLVDICPSTLRLMGITPPSTCDGKVVKGI